MTWIFSTRMSHSVFITKTHWVSPRGLRNVLNVFSISWNSCKTTFWIFQKLILLVWTLVCLLQKNCYVSWLVAATNCILHGTNSSPLALPACLLVHKQKCELIKTVLVLVTINAVGLHLYLNIFHNLNSNYGYLRKKQKFELAGRLCFLFFFFYCQYDSSCTCLQEQKHDKIFIQPGNKTLEI